MRLVKETFPVVLGRRAHHHAPLEKLPTHVDDPLVPGRLNAFVQMAKKFKAKLNTTVVEEASAQLRLAVAVVLAATDCTQTTGDLVANGTSARRLVEYTVGLEALAIPVPDCVELIQFLNTTRHGLLDELRLLSPTAVHAVVFRDFFKELVREFGPDQLRDIVLQDPDDAVILSGERVCDVLRISVGDLFGACFMEPRAAIQVVLELLGHYHRTNAERASSSDPLGKIPLLHPFHGVDMMLLARTNLKISDLTRVGVPIEWIFEMSNCSPDLLSAMGYGFQ